MDALERIEAAAKVAVRIANEAVLDERTCASERQVDRGLAVAVFNAIVERVPDGQLAEEEG